MPAVNGGLPQDIYDEFEEEMLNHPRFDSQSDAIEFAIRYTLNNKYNVDLE